MVNQVKEENIIIIMDNLRLLILQKNLRFWEPKFYHQQVLSACLFLFFIWQMFTQFPWLSMKLDDKILY